MRVILDLISHCLFYIFILTEFTYNHRQHRVKETVRVYVLDLQINVRESAIDLLGRIVKQRPDLIDLYLPMLFERTRV